MVWDEMGEAEERGCIYMHISRACGRVGSENRVELVSPLVYDSCT